MTEQYILGDIYIGNFVLTQAFGSNPGSYSKFGLAGHNGIDIGCPKGTPIIATADGIVRVKPFDPSGFGNRVDVQHVNFFSLYGHLDKIVVKDGQAVAKGQLLGYSGNTGNVDPPPDATHPNNGAHLHFGVYPTDNLGNKTEPNNTFGGAVDPDGNKCVWRITNPTKPTDPKVATYIHGGWYDNPETGKNQRWWVFPDGHGEFLPVGVTEPDLPPAPAVTEARDNQLESLKLDLTNERIAHGETAKKLATAESKIDILTEQLNLALNSKPIEPFPTDPISPNVIPVSYPVVAEPAPAVTTTDPVVTPVAEATHGTLVEELLQRLLGIVKRGGGTDMADSIKPGDQVIVAVKDWFKSTTVIFNASAIVIFIAKIIVQGGFITDPDVLAIGVALVNLLNRFRTKTPVSPTVGATPAKA